ncbi:hypothetical protein P4S72_17735 [Vibrio sp. PP-XX7]
MAKNQAARDLSLTYVEIIRGTPLLVQIFHRVLFIGTSPLNRFYRQVLSHSLCLPGHDMRLSVRVFSLLRQARWKRRSVKMTYSQAMRYVILPQAFKRTLPPLAGRFINLIKDSSLVSVISVTDLTKAGKEVVAGSLHHLKSGLRLPLLYLLVTGTLSWTIQLLEKEVIRQ